MLADCDGDPGSMSAAVLAIDNTAVDFPVLDQSEFAYVIVNFAPDLSVVGSTDYTALAPVAVVIGKPQGEQELSLRAPYPPA